MDTDEFQAFNTSLKTFVSDRFENNIKLYACQISGSILLSDSEKEVIKNAIPKRAYEFSAGRLCARKCLSYLGVEYVELLKGKFGEPLWPEGYTGSITHHDNVAVAVATRTNITSCIGIDLISKSESLENTNLITSNEEFKLIKNVSLDAEPGILIFSIKESVIKICSPLLQEFIDFRDVSLSLCDQGHLYASMNRLNQVIRVQWNVANNFIFSIATLDNTLTHNNFINK